MKLFKKICSLMLIIIMPICVGAQSEGILNKLLAPGPLIEGHKDLEGKDCLKCHDAGKGVPDNKCLECHKDIKKFVTAKKGFHGLNTQSCMTCHADHKGRSFDSTVFDLKKFDHAKSTGYSLDGKHAEIKCLECHTEKRSDKVIRKNETRFMGQVSSCVSCHKKQDPHFFKGPFASKDCNACHNSQSWKQNVKFDHFKDTRFKLESRHAELKCTDCHGPDKKSKITKYQWPQLKQAQCLSCHQDFHKKNLSPKFSTGASCTTCHSQQSWKISPFNHETTGYKLTGKHADIKCIECHKQPKLAMAKKNEIKLFNFTGLKQNCLSCHQDQHKNNLGPKFTGANACTTCHSTQSWKIEKFNHDVTKYKLAGKHAELKCIECHKQPQLPASRQTEVKLFNFKGIKSPAQCMTCHQDHHGFSNLRFSKLGLGRQCLNCHTEDSWKKTHDFSHNISTRFIIDGQHLDTKCNDCHVPQPRTNKKTNLYPLSAATYHWKNLEQKTCENCHVSPHTNIFSKALLQKKCTACHTTQDWTMLKTGGGFDHSKTKFTLTGAHKTAKCTDCHGPSGRQVFKFKSAQDQYCIDCHKNIHIGQFSTKFSANKCSECHTTKNFTERLQFDHNATNYKLIGEHKKLQCAECHKPIEKTNLDWPNFKSADHAAVKPVLKSKFLFPELKQQKCLACHQDYHKGQLSQSCSECHSENGWKPISFVHNKQSRFILRYKHETVDCNKCHKTTKDVIKFKNQLRPVVQFKPLSNTCVECHKDQHNGSFGRQCQECHTEKNWKSTKDFHKNFTLSGVHYMLDCAECHKDGKKLAGLSQQCLSCHQKDDVHNGTQPNCSACHTQHFWEATHFRHSLTRFPLRGSHRTLDCNECHTNGIYKGLSTTCVSCHLSDFQANPVPHVSGNTSCTDCHKNTFTFESAN